MLNVAEIPNIDKTNGNRPAKHPGHPFARAAAKIPKPLIAELFLSALKSFSL